jgi:hypothetical protein
MLDFKTKYFVRIEKKVYFNEKKKKILKKYLVYFIFELF